MSNNNFDASARLDRILAMRNAFSSEMAALWRSVAAFTRMMEEAPQPIAAPDIRKACASNIAREKRVRAFADASFREMDLLIAQSTTPRTIATLTTMRDNNKREVDVEMGAARTAVAWFEQLDASLADNTEDTSWK